MLQVVYSKAFKRDLKKIDAQREKEGLKCVLNQLINEEQLSFKYHPHALVGIYEGFYECHVLPDLLLIYEIKEGILYLYRLGSHSKLFK